MPVGHIETAPRGERDPKARFVALRVDELSAAEGPANERKVLVLKDTTEKAMPDTTEQQTTVETTKEGEGSTPAATPPVGEPDPVAALAAEMGVMREQLAALQAKTVPAAKDGSATVVPAANAPERKTAEVQLVKKSVGEGKPSIVHVAKATDGLQPDFLQRVTAALAPLMVTIDSISVGMCWMDDDIVNISFSGEPMTTATAKDTAQATSAAATAETASSAEATVLADVAKDLKTLAATVTSFGERIENIEKARGVTRAVVKDAPAGAATTPQKSIFEGAV